MKKRPVPTWLMIARGLSQFGWQTELLRSDRIVFALEGYNERIEAKKMPKINKWKVEHYTSGKLDDIAGIGTETEAKMLASEMAIIRADWKGK